MDNPMRDVVEQMKNTAQREGKQQTTLSEKQDKERRRLVEHLTTAQINAENVYKEMLSVSMYNTEPSRLTRIALLKNAVGTLREQIDTLLQEVQGE